MLAMPSQAPLQVMLFVTDLLVEMLPLVSKRYRRANPFVVLLLSGIKNVHIDSHEQIEQTTLALGKIHFCVAKTSRHRQQRHEHTEAEQLSTQ